MAKSRYVAKAEVPSFDAELSRWLGSLDDDCGGHEMITAIENDAGQIYRVITTEGMGAYISITSQLAAMGLRDCLQHTVNSFAGCDSLFQVRRE